MKTITRQFTCLLRVPPRFLPDLSTPMKVIRGAVSGAMLAGVLILTLLSSSGCTTFSNPDSKAALLADLRDVAQVGTAIDLADNPKHREAFLLVLGELESIATMENATPLTLHQALLKLPIRQLKGEKAALYVTAANIILRRILNGKEVPIPSQVREVAAALAAGLRGALNQN